MAIDLFGLVDIEYDEIKDTEERAYVFKFGEKEGRSYDVRVPTSLITIDIDDKTITIPEWAAVMLNII